MQHRAASKGYEDIVQFLIEVKVDINLRGMFLDHLINGHRIKNAENENFL